MRIVKYVAELEVSQFAGILQTIRVNMIKINKWQAACDQLPAYFSLFAFRFSLDGHPPNNNKCRARDTAMRADGAREALNKCRLPAPQLTLQRNDGCRARNVATEYRPRHPPRK